MISQFVPTSDGNLVRNVAVARDDLSLRLGFLRSVFHYKIRGRFTCSGERIPFLFFVQLQFEWCRIKPSQTVFSQTACCPCGNFKESSDVTEKTKAASWSIPPWFSVRLCAGNVESSWSSLNCELWSGSCSSHDAVACEVETAAAAEIGGVWLVCKGVQSTR